MAAADPTLAIEWSRLATTTGRNGELDASVSPVLLTVESPDALSALVQVSPPQDLDNWRRTPDEGL